MKNLQPDFTANMPDSTLICHCGNVSKGQILRALAAGNHSLEQIRQATGACPDNHDCAANNPKGRCCIPDIMALVRAYGPTNNILERLTIPTIKQP